MNNWKYAIWGGCILTGLDLILSLPILFSYISECGNTGCHQPFGGFQIMYLFLFNFIGVGLMPFNGLSDLEMAIGALIIGSIFYFLIGFLLGMLYRSLFVKAVER